MPLFRLEKGKWPIPDGTRLVDWGVFREGDSQPFTVTIDKKAGEAIADYFNKHPEEFVS